MSSVKKIGDEETIDSGVKDGKVKIGEQSWDDHFKGVRSSRREIMWHY